MQDERVIRVAEIPAQAHPLSIHAGDPPQPLVPRWAAIALSVSDRRPSYLLYLLGEDGAVLDALQFESMQIVLDQALALLKVAPSAWSTCDFVVPDGDVIEPHQFVRYLAG